MGTQQRYLKLARSLPPPLLRLFQRYPSPALLQLTGQAQSSGQDPPPTASVSSDHSRPSNEAASGRARASPNPFRAQKHPLTGRWHDPVYSLRRQANLVKLAREHGVEELLPFTTKGTAERRRRRQETGLRVKGTGKGERVKGHKWERTMKARLEKRRQAMLSMPTLVRSWRERGHGRGWTNWPK